MEQLELDLWSELRVSEFDVAQRKGVLNEILYDAFVYGEKRVLVMHDPMSMHTIVRYRV